MNQLVFRCKVYQFRMKLLWITTFFGVVVISYFYPTSIDAHRQPDPDPIVETCHGPVRGTLMISRENRTYYAFMGIPYAKPPVGDLRFKPPVPPEERNYIFNAQKDGPVCIQKNYLFADPQVEGSEDCLNLNVYTPSLTSKKFAAKTKPLPVLVVINWGGFFAGYGNSSYHGPEYFMDKDIVLVTFNYRLGVLGFLSTNDDVCPGNWGLKDQVAALKWIHDNIFEFGGNNKKVTLMGQSAGGACVHYHMLSPTTKHLFHGAISLSGSALNIWAKPMNEFAPSFAKMQAKFVGCTNDTSTKEIINCLRKVDAHELVNSADNFKYFDVEPLTVFGPVKEKKTPENLSPYIAKDPLQIIEDREFHLVPWIIGIVQNEGVVRAASLLRKKENRINLSKNFDAYMPNMMALGSSVGLPNIEELWNEIKLFYFGSGKNGIEPLTWHGAQGLINLYSDRGFVHDVYQTALLHASRGHNLIWMYNFAYKGMYSYAEHFASTKETIDFNDWGVGHCDDLLYLFKTPSLFPELTDDSDLLMSHIMVQLFTDFSTYGNPVPTREIRGLSIHWDKIPNLSGAESNLKNEYLTLLNITGPYIHERIPIQFVLEHGLYRERMKFWQELPLSENVHGIE